jgi:DNA modification methylase
MTYKILKGNSLELLPTLADNSIDAIVTDPPYGLGNPDPDYIIKAIQLWASGDRSHIPEGKGFMGKSWDSFVPPPAIWDECLRVLKPGGHLLAFAGTRTYDLMGISIRMAGFEIRDSIGWVYGSGFPKSLDVSKAIDKRGGESIGWFGEWLRNWRKENNITQKEVAALFPSKSGNLTGCVANWELGLNLPTADQFTTICRHFNLPFASLAEAEREVIGKKENAMAGWNMDGSTKFVDRDITAPSTPEAKQWQGWGTALKPALEPIVVARKPLIGTVAENVLTHGTGGLNIDASRIRMQEGEKVSPFGSPTKSIGGLLNNGVVPQDKQKLEASYEKTNTEGRWPANLILDEYTAELLDEQSGVLASGGGDKSNKQPKAIGSQVPANLNAGNFKAEKGGASRFFYVAKASKRDRNEGLEDFEAQRHSDRELDDGAGGDNPRNRTNNAKQNFHPTVKPTELMRYLVKLITPPGGTVLDPFTGSGSTGKAAILEGFDFIGIELTEDYWPIIEGRLKHAEAKVAEAKEKIEAQPQGLF